MKDLISVVVPVYNVEKYLKRCVDSIINQTYLNLQIILVNDGSLDHCGPICDEYAKLDSRIEVIHQQNLGLSMARNSGIDAATGDFITFIDSDDWVHGEYIERLVDLLKMTNSDISVCNFIKTHSEKVHKEMMYEEEVIEFSNIEALSELTVEKYYTQMVVAWGKLYRRNLFDTVRFPAGKIHEDEFTTYKLIYNAQKVILTTKPLLYYWQRDDSIMGSGFSMSKRYQLGQAFRERAEFFNDVGLIDMRDKTYKMLFYILKELVELDVGNHDPDIIKAVTDEFSDLKTSLRRSKQKIKFKIGYECYYYMPSIMKKLYKLYEKLLRFRSIKGSDI